MTTRPRSSRTGPSVTVHDIGQLFPDEHPPAEFGRLVQGARVAWFDFELILSDFPLLDKAVQRLERREAESRLIQWLLGVGPLMSEAQLVTCAANDPVSVGDTRIPIFRPVSYGRAALLDTSLLAVQGLPPTQGLIDIKGCGVREGKTPSTGSHASGLLPLPTAIGDLIMQRIIEQAFEILSAPVTCVPVYAILDLGFRTGPNVQDADTVPAAVMLRRARPRIEFNRQTVSAEESLAHVQLAMTIELLLRHFGITSGRTVPLGTWELHPKCRALMEIVGAKLEGTFERANVQFTKDFTLTPLAAELVDFRQYGFASSFEGPLVGYSIDKKMRRTHHYFTKDDPRWVQPLEHLRLPDAVTALQAFPEDLRTWGGYSPGAVGNGVRCLEVKLARDSSERDMSPASLDHAIKEFVRNAFHSTH